jgi:RNA polymerase sigma-70 factor (ECF subfamily)
MLEQTYLEALSHVTETSSASPEAVVSHLQEVRVIDAALATLAPRARLAFVMHRIDGKTHAEIAEHLGVSVSMVRKYITISEQKCRANLSDA